MYSLILINSQLRTWSRHAYWYIYFLFLPNHTANQLLYCTRQ